MSRNADIVLAPTPLHERTALRSRTNAWGEWNGYTVAETYGDVTEEARALTRATGLTDLTPQPVFRVTGDDAGKHLDQLLTRPVSTLNEGEIRTALMCAETGHVIDRCLVGRLDEKTFYLLGRVPVGARVAGLAGTGDVSVAGEGGAMIGIVGAARAQLLAATGLNAPIGEEGLISATESRGLSMTLIDYPVAQTTYVRANAEDAPLVWERFVKTGESLGLMPVGLAALDRWRIDRGEPVAGREFQSALVACDAGRRAFPSELGWAQLIADDGRAFSGAAALRTSPGTRALVRAEIPQPFTLEGAALVEGERELGRITSAYVAAEHRLASGLALIDQPERPEDVLAVTRNGTIGAALKFF